MAEYVGRLPKAGASEELEVLAGAGRSTVRRTTSSNSSRNEPSDETSNEAAFIARAPAGLQRTALSSCLR